MSELLLKIGEGSGFDDGDILCAFNRRAIRCVHAQQICHVRKAKRNSSGLIQMSELCRDWFEATHQYRFERQDARRMRRRNLWTGDVEIISDIPNEKGEAIDLGAFLTRRKRNPNHQIFNVDGREIWYGGAKDFSDTNLSKVWTAIETKSPHRETAFQRWPAGNQDKKSHLMIRTDDFDDATASDLVAPEVDNTDLKKPVVIQKRLNQVKWESLPGINVMLRERILDKTQEIDLREILEHKRTDVVRRKPNKIRR